MFVRPEAPQSARQEGGASVRIVKMLLASFVCGDSLMVDLGAPITVQY